eukprot:scpid11238/ scgid0127/ C-type mannose receptor 2; Lectin lambda; Macrophage mannose receptor 2
MESLVDAVRADAFCSRWFMWGDIGALHYTSHKYKNWPAVSRLDICHCVCMCVLTCVLCPDGHTNYPVCGCAIQHCRRRPQQGQRCPSAQAGALLALLLILVIQFGSGQCRVLGWMGDLSGTQQFNNCSNWNVTGLSDCTPKENDTFIVPNSPDKAFTIEWFIDGDITLANLAFGRSDRVDKSTLLFIFNAKTTATLHVTNLLEIHSKTWTFRYGANTTSSSNTINVIAKDLKWSGRLLRSQLFTAFPTVLVTRQMTAFNGRREATHTKVLTSVVLSIAGNASWHGTSVQSVDGTIRVLPGALLHSFVPNWMQSGSDDGYDLIVDGTARLACATSCTLQTYIAVAGQLEFIPAVLSSDQDASLPTWTLLSGGLHAAGSVVFYFTNINVMPSKLQLLFGSWRVFGPPVVNSTYSFSSSTTTRWWEDITDPATQTIEYNFQQPVLITIAVHSSFWNLTIDAFTSRGPAQWRIMPMPSGVTTVDLKTALDMDEHGVLRLISAPVQFTTSFTVHSQLISSLGYVFVGDNWHMMLSGDHNTDIKRQVAVGRGALLEVPASIDGLIPVVDFQSQLYLKSRLVISGASLQVKDLFVDSTAALGDGIVLRTTASLIVSHQLTWKGGTIEGQGSTVKLRQGAVLTTNHTKSLLNATVTLEIDGSSAARRGGCIIEYFQYRHLLPTAVLTPPAMIQGFYNKSSLGTGTYRLPEAFDDPTTLADYSTLETSCSHNSEHYGRAPVLFSSAGIASSTDHLSFTENYAVRHTTRFFSHVAGDYVFTFAWSYSIVRFWFDGHVLVTFCGDGSQTSDGCNTDVRANISGTVTVPNLSKRQHEIRLDLIRLPPKPSTNQSFVVNYKFEVSAHVSGSTAQLGATNTLWGCQASGVSVIRFYPQTSFRIRFPENVCQTRSTPADLCSIKLGVACMRLSNTSLTLGKNSSIVVRRTGVLWLQNSSSIQEQVANTGSSIQRYGLIVNDAGGSLLQLAVSAHAHSCTSASALSVLPSMVSSDTTVQQGSCRFGAYEHMGRCYYPEVTSGPSPGAYQAGVGACACRGGFLASITSNSTAVFVNKMLQLTRAMIKGTPASATFYVGLKEPGCSSSNMLHAYTQTEWDDGSCPEQLPLPLQPSPRTPACQPCFVLEKNYTSSVDGSSRLVQRSCTETSHRFICIEPPYSDVEPLAVKTCTNLSCSTGWTKYNSHCYRTRPAGVPALTHDDAAAQCFTTGAELISINDFAEQQILTPLIKADSFRVTFYWMGLYESGGNFRWRDGSAAVFRSWQCSDSNKNDIVNTALGQVAVDDKSIADSWFQVLTSDSSSRTGSYICEMRPPRQDGSFWPPQLQQGGCRAEWFEYKQICYMFNASVARNWDGAKTECSAHGQNASLVEIYDVSILTVLQNHIMTSPPVGLPPGQCEWWIGLRRVNFKFQWLSGAPTSYLPWACGDDQSSKNCVHMRTCTTRSAFNNGWVTGTCSPLRPYICQYQMGAVSHATSPTVSTATEMASPHTNPATATSMSSQLVPSSVQPTAQATTSSATTGPSSTSESASQSTSVSTSTQQPTSQTSLPATTPIAQTLPITTPSAPQTTLTAAQPISQTPLSGTQATPQAPSSTPQPTPGTQPVSQTALSAAQTNVSTPPASTTEKEPNGTGQQLTTQSSLITTPGTAQGTVTTLAGTSSATTAAVPPVTSQTSLPITSANTTDVGTATAAPSTGMTTNTQTQPTNTMQSTTKATGTVNQLTVTMVTNTQQTPSSSSSSSPSSSSSSS